MLNFINMQPLFAVQGQNRSRDFYLSVDITTTVYCNLFTTCLTHGLKMDASSINSNHWILESKWFFSEFLLQRKILFIKVNTRVIRRAFWHIVPTHVDIFVPFPQGWTLGFLCTTAQHFATFLYRFSVWFFRREFIPLTDLLHIGFTIIEICLWWWAQEAKICKFLIFIDKMAMLT